MVPIGVVTRDRINYLDTTLRSLSASAIPADVPLRVFSDHSDTAEMRRYLETDEVIPTTRNWPTGNAAWKRAGLDFVAQQDQHPVGIASKIQVRRLPGTTSLGVFAASLFAIRALLDEFPLAEGLFLLQDDIVVKADWYARMLAAREIQLSRPLGVLSGMRLNRAIVPGKPVIESHTTAQCLYIPRSTVERLSVFFGQRSPSRKQFDDRLCDAVTKAGLAMGLLCPFVCQHIGVVSEVRPGRKWERSPNRGRIGYLVAPPFAYGDTIRIFP